MKVKTKSEFFQAVKKSQLLSPRERVEAREAAQGISDPETVARQLVEAGRLTRWQAGQLLAGKTRLSLGKYRLLKVSGRGGMGIVFKAEQPDVKRVVAIKVLHRSLLSKPRAVSRFLREMRLAAALNHPNLVVAFDADQMRDTYFLVMEYVSGKSLKHYSLKHGRLPVAWSCECIRQAALGLAHVHERGLVHRDVKPSNLLVLRDSFSRIPRIKILDVGLSRFVSETEEEGGLTRAGQILGTMDYMAPEQVKDARTADIRADIYSLGATLYQLLIGSPPLAGKTMMQTYLARMTQEPPSISSLRAGTPAALDSIVSRMLDRDPEKRYHAPSEVAAALAAVLSGEPGVDMDLRSGPDPTARAMRIESSADLDSVDLASASAIETDSSLLTFLDQLSQDETENVPPIVLTTDTPLPQGHRNAAPLWSGLIHSARRWLRSVLPNNRHDAEPEPPARSAAAKRSGKSPARRGKARKTRRRSKAAPPKNNSTGTPPDLPVARG